MKNYNNDEDFKTIVEDIIKDDTFNKLSLIAHHGETRMDHSLKVSYYSYKISKTLKLDYIDVARAGLLHDFYFDRTKDYKKFSKKVQLYTTGHPKCALENANKLFILSDKEKDIIKCHMFPIDFRIPKYMETWVVNLVDTFVSIKEFTMKFKYQLTSIANLWLVLFINLMK